MGLVGLVLSAILGGVDPTAVGVPTTVPDESVAGRGAPAGACRVVPDPDTPVLAKSDAVAAPPVLTIGSRVAAEFWVAPRVEADPALASRWVSAALSFGEGLLDADGLVVPGFPALARRWVSAGL